MALAAYRHVLRSARVAFQGDARTLLAARREARTSFEANRHLPSDHEDVITGIQQAEEVAKILRHNVVQGAEGQRGNYKLRIHEDTEKGDNESVKLGKVEGRKETDLSGGAKAWGAR